MLAAVEGHLAVVRALLEAGADIDIQSDVCEKCLCVISSQGRLHFIWYLTDHMGFFS